MATYTSTVKPYKGMGMEGAVARWYASLTKKSAEDFRILAQRAAKQLAPKSKVLEIAPGPGYFAIELAKIGQYEITGLDISQTFVEIAQANAAKASVSVDFQRGNASHMPFATESFDFLLCRAAFKNFTEPVPALQEMHRVLKPGGRALIIDLRRDASNNDIAKAAQGMNLGMLNAAIVKLTFRFLLLKRAYTKSEFEKMIDRTQFTHLAIREDPIGFEIEMEKHI